MDNVCVCVRYIDERKGENVNSAEGFKIFTSRVRVLRSFLNLYIDLV